MSSLEFSKISLVLQFFMKIFRKFHCLDSKISIRKFHVCLTKLTFPVITLIRCTVYLSPRLWYLWPLNLTGVGRNWDGPYLFGLTGVHFTLVDVKSKQAFGLTYKKGKYLFVKTKLKLEEFKTEIRKPFSFTRKYVLKEIIVRPVRIRAICCRCFHGEPPNSNFHWIWSGRNFLVPSRPTFAVE